MKKFLNIVGARPQIIKSAAISRAVRKSYSSVLNEIIVHTGQHYDENMSEIFFKELEIPLPHYNLNAKAGLHGKQTSIMLERLEELMITENPDFVVVYGDTNSTVAAALAATKLHIPIVHIEAGLRSYNKSMPEEINRIVTDHVSTLLFPPTLAGLNNLVREGFKLEATGNHTIDNPGVFLSGDIMFDNSLFFSHIAEKKDNNILFRKNLINQKFVLVTIHRDMNTDVNERLQNIVKALIEIAKNYNIKLIIPMHPRTFKKLSMPENKRLMDSISYEKNIIIIDPVSFLDMILLEKYAEIIITDSGGVQKEAYFFQKPAIVLRKETEWIETVEVGNSVLTDADKEKIITSFENFSKNKPVNYPNIFGDGKAAEFICKRTLESLG